MIHGAALVVHRIWSKFLGFSMPVLPAKVLTFLFVLLAWVPFRATTMAQAKVIYLGMFMPQSWTLPHLTGFEWSLFAAGIIVTLFFPTMAETEKKFQPTWVNALLAAALLVSCMFLFVKTSPFIYFNF